MKTVLLGNGRKEKLTLNKFLKNVYPEPNTGCWLGGWKPTKKGYGNTKKITIDRMILRGSHRISYYLHNGKFDYSLCVCHSCDTPSCVNPDHLFLATSEQNTEDMRLKGRASKGSHRPTAKLIESDIKSIRLMWQSGKSAINIGKIYKVERSTIYAIINGLTWGHIK